VFNRFSGKSKKKKPKINTKNPCDKCIPAKCCMYFSIEIDEPEDAGDYDDLLWIIAHKDVEIYVNEGDWFLMVQSPCRFYDPVKGCLIYPKRPRICRKHRLEECEFDEGYDFDEHFHNYEELDRYIRNNT
jgi:Fe-S-cluster containining protein